MGETMTVIVDALWHSGPTWVVTTRPDGDLVTDRRRDKAYTETIGRRIASFA